MVIYCRYQGNYCLELFMVVGSKWYRADRRRCHWSIRWGSPWWKQSSASVWWPTPPGSVATLQSRSILHRTTVPPVYTLQSWLPADCCYRWYPSDLQRLLLLRLLLLHQRRHNVCHNAHGTSYKSHQEPNNLNQPINRLLISWSRHHWH